MAKLLVFAYYSSEEQIATTDLQSCLVCVVLDADIVKVDTSAWRKILKRHFFKDIENSFQGVTYIGLEPHQFFSF